MHACTMLNGIARTIIASVEWVEKQAPPSPFSTYKAVKPWKLNCTRKSLCMLMEFWLVAIEHFSSFHFFVWYASCLLVEVVVRNKQEHKTIPTTYMNMTHFHCVRWGNVNWKEKSIFIWMCVCAAALAFNVTKVVYFPIISAFSIDFLKNIELFFIDFFLLKTRISPFTLIWYAL